MEIFRNLWRLDNQTFTRGRTHIKDEDLPPFYLYSNATKVQDETWELANGSYITKYDWVNYVRDRDFYGIYGDFAGSWWIHPTTEYFSASQLSQTLTVSDTSPPWKTDGAMLRPELGSPRICHWRRRPTECLPRHFALQSRQRYSLANW